MSSRPIRGGSAEPVRPPVSFDLVVEVEQCHLDTGAPASCRDCPLALAILSACRRMGLEVDRYWQIEVYGDSATLWPVVGLPYAASLPAPARDFVRRFDHGDASECRPFAMTLTFEAALLSPLEVT